MVAVTPRHARVRAVVLLLCLFPFWVAFLTLGTALAVVLWVREAIDRWVVHRQVRRYLAQVHDEAYQEGRDHAVPPVVRSPDGQA